MTTKKPTEERLSEFTRLFGLFMLYGGVEEAEHPKALRARTHEIMETMMSNIANIHKQMEKNNEGDFYKEAKKRGGKFVVELVDLLEEILAE